MSYTSNPRIFNSNAAEHIAILQRYFSLTTDDKTIHNTIMRSNFFIGNNMITDSPQEFLFRLNAIKKITENDEYLHPKDPQLFADLISKIEEICGPQQEASLTKGR